MRLNLMRRRAVRVLAPVLALALVLAACGNGDDPEPAAPADSEADPDPEPEPEPEPDAPPFYEGETVRILIPTGPGGGQDSRAQWMQSWWHECLPGNPSIELYYSPGGGGIAGGNEFELATERDGLTITQTSQSMATNEFLGHDEIQFSRDRLNVFMVFPNSGAMVISPDTGLEDIADVADYDGTLFIGGNSPVASDLMAIMALETLGLLGDPIRYVWGYESSGDHRLAFEQGETQVDAGPTTNYVSNILPLVEAGLATPLLLYGIPGPDAYERIPYPDLHGAPTVEEAHELLYGEAPSGNAYEALIATLNMLYGANTVALHVDDPPEAHAAVAEAVDCMWEGGFYDDYVEDLSPIGPIADQAVIGPLQDRIASLDPNLRDWIWEFLRETFPGEVPQ